MLHFHLITTPSRKTLVRKLKCFVSLNCFSDKTYGDISSSVSRTTLKTSSVINESIFSHSALLKSYIYFIIEIVFLVFWLKFDVYIYIALFKNECFTVEILI